jgi:hypothetical protein
MVKNVEHRRMIKETDLQIQKAEAQEKAQLQAQEKARLQRTQAAVQFQKEREAREKDRLQKAQDQLKARLQEAEDQQKARLQKAQEEDQFRKKAQEVTQLLKDRNQIVNQYIEDEKRATKDEISFLEKEIAEGKETIRRLSKGMGNYTREERKKAIKVMNEYIAVVQNKIGRLKNGQETIPPSLPYAKLAVGQIGSITLPESLRGRTRSEFSYKIFQIVDDNNFLLDIRIKVLDRSVELSPFWIKGISTSLLVDNMEYCPKGIFCVTGTKRYTTITGGSKTTFVLQPIDIDSLK